LAPAIKPSVRCQHGIEQTKISLGGHRSIVDLKGVPASTTYDLGSAADSFAGISNVWGALMVATSHQTLVREEQLMSVIHFHAATTSTPEQFIAGLTDFGPGRSKTFKNSADSYLMVHNKGPHQADVTEGSGGIWERLLYDWSDPSHVELTTIDSNVFGGASGYTYTLTPQSDGMTDVDVVIVREGKNFKGRVLSGVLGTIAKRSLGKAFSNSVKAIETQTATSAAGESAATAS
jgi:hypothetical protein